MRIAIGGIMHESNGFSPAQTGLADFSIQRGSEIMDWWHQAHHEIGGFIEGVPPQNLIPTLMAAATPSGPVTAAAFEALTGELIARLRAAQPLDGLLLALHGAMIAEHASDGDGEIAQRVRAELGPDFPIIITHDYHANIAQRLVEAATALVVYKTNPHLDQRARGIQAARLLLDTLQGNIRPVQAHVKPPMLLNIVHQYTSRDPMRSIVQVAAALEQQPGILAVNVAAGYQYADVPEMGPSVVVVTNGAADLAQRSAQALADRLWDSRSQLAFELPNAAAAVRQAIRSPETPVVLVDMGDNIGGGSAGDSTFVLRELLDQRAQGWVVVLADPEAVQICAQAGINHTVCLEVGGKMDDRHGSPVTVQGRVKVLHDGQYVETEARHGGQRYHQQGLTALLEVGESGIPGYVVLTSRREPPFSLGQLLSLGIQPQHQRILVVKAAIAFRAAYEPIAARIIEVDTPGLTAVNPAHFTYSHVRRPLWGLPEV